MVLVRAVRNAKYRLLLYALALAPALGHAAPDEIQVYMDDLTKPGRVGMDLHNNYTIKGATEPDYPGAAPTHHMYRFTPELYLGLTPTVELGLYLLTTSTPDFGRRYEGEKLRLKYIAPHNEEAGPFWGVNLEVGYTAQRVSQVPWNTELKAIYGFRAGRWTVAWNANLDWSLHGSPSAPVEFQLATKVAYRTRAGYHIGFESYNDLGPLRHAGRFGEQGQMLYAVVDTELGKVDLNAGIGRGFTSASDRWVAKFILGFQY